MKIISLISATGIVFLLAMMIQANASDSTMEVRGQAYSFGQNQVSMNSTTFPGFFYDIDNNIGAEKLTLRLSNIDADRSSAILSDQPDNDGNRGIVYDTKAQPLGFSFAPWGQYEVIGFLGDEYFAAYDGNITEDIQDANETAAFLFDKSDNRNLMPNEQISKVLLDDDTEQTITLASPLKLEEGYQLAIKSVDSKGNKVNLELTKNGRSVDDKVIQPSISNAKMDDKTYYYKTDLGETKDIILIAVHFKNAFQENETNIATIDGIFQISDKPTALKSGQQYDKMSLRNVNPNDFSITMDNKDNQITLSKNKDVLLMKNIHIKTADQDTITADQPLRYFIYKAATSEAANATASSVS